jgi:hypothetical protein
MVRDRNKKSVPASCIMFLTSKKKRRGTKAFKVKFPGTEGGYRDLALEPRRRVDHNPERHFPAAKDKTRQSRTEGNCLQMSMLAALRGLRSKLPHATFMAAERLCVEEFDDIIAASGHHGALYGSPAGGYKAADLVDFVRHLSDNVMHRVGLHLRMRKMQKPGYAWLFNQVASKRRGRAFVCFGSAPGTLKKQLMLTKLKFCLQHGVCVPFIYGDQFMPKDFWAGTRDHWQPHAICLKYDSCGRGVVDDPALAAYHSLEIESVMTCLAYLYGMYEISVVAKSDRR